MSPVTAPVSENYLNTEIDPPINHSTIISDDKLQERVRRKYISSDPSKYIAPKKDQREVLIVGGGHNGLVSAAYLAKAGVDTLVLERRHCVGGAAVTEEIVPGFKFSRASYLAGLFRPQIIVDLELEKYGFKYLPRNPSSFTPTRLNSAHEGKYLLLGESDVENSRSIAQFSQRDAEAFPKYEAFLGQIREIMQPLLDNAPPDLTEGRIREKLRTLQTIGELASISYKNKDVLVPFYELFTGPAALILDRWFESDILKTTLATDAVVGALVSPSHNGSAYVLLHHVMGEAAGRKGVWAYVQGGMGAVSEAIASSARSSGAEIVTNATVRRILTSSGRAVGVCMDDGSEVFADSILSGATPYHTFMELLPGLTREEGVEELNPVPADFARHIRNAGEQY
jgi:phytoene dehydrogenase-like protein